MGLIEKDDLKFDYDWSSQPGDDPVKKEDIGSNVFNKNQGKDVLNMLNNYAEEHNITDKNDVLDAEGMLRDNLPKDLNTETNIIDWLWSELRKNADPG
jgi:hypothetical protein